MRNTDSEFTNKQEFIATFFSHFGAIRFKKECEAKGWSAALEPVPRSLSSSCGTCVRFRSELPVPVEQPRDELEQVVRVLKDGSYQRIYSAMEED